jgi:hypothetical protein
LKALICSQILKWKPFPGQGEVSRTLNMLLAINIVRNKTGSIVDVLKSYEENIDSSLGITHYDECAVVFHVQYTALKLSDAVHFVTVMKVSL